ncbi:YwqH-like family protein [Peribacillus sp. NPDC097675]|uniref:YwqH-like family protein n=1 Tax=Peribacillus sp. NPDC097675 TaxID=3390618 RepID=UPI003D08BB3B
MVKQISTDEVILLGLVEVISDYSSSFSSGIANLEEQISRLKQAKTQINNEQEASLIEIKEIKKPELGKSWTGNRATDFNESRSGAYKVMLTIVQNEYDDYQEKIEQKIILLEIQKATLEAAAVAAREASELLAKGEAFLDQVESKVSDLKKLVF